MEPVTPDQAEEYLRSIAITALGMQYLTGEMDQQERDSLRQIDDDLNSLADYLEEADPD